MNKKKNPRVNFNEVIVKQSPFFSTKANLQTFQKSLTDLERKVTELRRVETELRLTHLDSIKDSFKLLVPTINTSQQKLFDNNIRQVAASEAAIKLKAYEDSLDSSRWARVKDAIGLSVKPPTKEELEIDNNFIWEVGSRFKQTTLKSPEDFKIMLNRKLNKSLKRYHGSSKSSLQRSSDHTHPDYLKLIKALTVSKVALRDKSITPKEFTCKFTTNPFIGVTQLSCVYVTDVNEFSVESVKETFLHPYIVTTTYTIPLQDIAARIKELSCKINHTLNNNLAYKPLPSGDLVIKSGVLENMTSLSKEAIELVVEFKGLMENEINTEE